MDQHVVPQPAGGGAGKREAFRSVRNRAVGSGGLPLVLFSVCHRFGLGMRRLIQPDVESLLSAGLG